MWPTGKAGGGDKGSGQGRVEVPHRLQWESHAAGAGVGI